MTVATEPVEAIDFVAPFDTLRTNSAVEHFLRETRLSRHFTAYAQLLSARR